MAVNCLLADESITNAGTITTNTNLFNKINIQMVVANQQFADICPYAVAGSRQQGVRGVVVKAAAWQWWQVVAMVIQVK